MARMLVFVVLCVAVSGHPRSQHVKFPKSDDNTGFRKGTCGGDNARERESIIEQSKCGEPKEVFVYLDPKAVHEQVSPGAVWVKRCVGLCEYDNEGSCVPTATVTRHIPIRIFNAKTNKETCATYPVEEHVSCGCCAHTPQGCAPPRVYNPPEPEYEVE
ncbi:hypothetical protein K1T71_005323 [Dendrolimus kikuchii]|uniref:Uncharacterized protein n=1 Tax=Dendrolimus kikuchii TaxID=765133 RepID=A0ACC1D6M3_9NEOP|nr:hypothetical protein K1T71_005323 [Dendrolimus kikuchii]